MKSQFNPKSIAEYVSRAIKHYKEVQDQQKNYLYKIVDKETDKHGQEHFVVQLVGKSVVMKFTPEEIAADDALLKGFSPLDVRTITYFACKDKFAREAKVPIKQSIFKVVAQAFSRTFKREMITLQNQQTQELVTRPISEISKAPELISQLDAQDAHMVGYVAGMESVVGEQESKANK